MEEVLSKLSPKSESLSQGQELGREQGEGRAVQSQEPPLCVKNYKQLDNYRKTSFAVLFFKLEKENSHKPPFLVTV